MPPNKKSRTGRLFYCTGFGDCKMVFTRGEHLARHIRKHTGEKPFQCIIPDCTKTFSRFDNMMQHTQTHKRREQYHHSTCTKKEEESFHSLHYHDLIHHEEEEEKVLLRQPNIGLTSPISLASSLDSSDEEELDEFKDHWMNTRRLSIADLCHPIDQPPNIHQQLSFDEVEALLAFGKLQQSNSL